MFRRLGYLSHSPAVLIAEIPDRCLSVHFSCMASTFFVGDEPPPADNVGFLQRAKGSLYLLRYYHIPVLVMVVQFIRFQRASSVGTRNNISTVRATTDSRENPVPRSLFGTYRNHYATIAHSYSAPTEWLSGSTVNCAYKYGTKTSKIAVGQDGSSMRPTDPPPCCINGHYHPRRRAVCSW